jgi:hypothetical protein
MSGAKRGATFEDLETVPPNCVGEIVGGELYVSPPPGLTPWPGSGCCWVLPLKLATLWER